MNVEKLMTAPACCCGAEDTLARAAERMWEHDCGVVPVVDGDGRLAGIVTDRDVCMAAWTQGRSLHEIPVHTAMAREVVSCKAGETIESALGKMRDARVRRLPIVDAEMCPIGVLSLNDVARHAARVGGGERDLTRTLAAICELRAAAVEPLPAVAPACAIAVAAHA